jgi:hypothetical protein
MLQASQQYLCKVVYFAYFVKWPDFLMISAGQGTNIGVI